MPQTQTADGRGRPQVTSVYNPDFRVFVAGADVQGQRLDAYEEEYAEMALKGTQKAICCGAGGELHLPEGGIMPIAPWDWVVELPDGTMGSFTAEQVADTFEFIDGPDEQREAFERTKQYVKNAREAKHPRTNPPIKVDPGAEVVPHPDSGEAAAIEEARRNHAHVQDAYRRQVEEARRNLEQVVNVARDRKIVTKAEADEWLDSGFAPDGVRVTFQQALGSWEVSRDKADTTKSDPGDTEIRSDGDDGQPDPLPDAENADS